MLLKGQRPRARGARGHCTGLGLGLLLRLGLGARLRARAGVRRCLFHGLRLVCAVGRRRRDARVALQPKVGAQP
eukprot:1659411-Prymnesium_polylepis.2